MKTPRSLVALTLINLALLLLTFGQQLRPALAQGEVPVLRGRGLEIVDAQGRVRASISVLPAKNAGVHRSRSRLPSPAQVCASRAPPATKTRT